jgi:hypothetical protein
VRLSDFFFLLENRVATGGWNILSVAVIQGDTFQTKT